MAESEQEIAVRPRFDLAVEYIDDDLVVLDKKLGQIHQLNSTASLVWKGIVAGESWGTIQSRLMDRFDVPPDTARQDVEKLVEQFKTLKLLDSK